MGTLARQRSGVVLLIWCVCASATAQNYFPATIPTSSLAIPIENFATVPDSSPGQPARISVLTRDPLGRIFANDQRGPLYTINGTGSAVTEYLDIRDYAELAINAGGESGFQGFAFHPDFATTGAEGYGRFYTIHSTNNTSSTPDFDPGGGTSFHEVLLEWRTNNPSATTFTPAVPAQPYREVLRLKQPFSNHNTGLIAFNTTAGAADADYGNLYVAVGDGGSGGDPQENGQDPSNPFGALLRIDPLGTNGINGRYGIVADNVLASDGNPSTLGEIYAYGLRNPQRFGWDSATGRMFIADIGQDAVEEINLGANGANFGWDDREGSFPFESANTLGLTDPVAEYDHTNVVSDPPSGITNRAITVGEVVRGSSNAQFNGLLPLGDFPLGLIFLLDVDQDPLDGGQDGLLELKPRNAGGQPVRLLQLINQVRTARGLSAVTRTDMRFGINTPGEVYITNKQDGVIRRLVLGFAPGDFDQDGDVDGADFLVWQRDPGVGNLADWQAGYGASLVASARAGSSPTPAFAVPEPSAGFLLLPGLLVRSTRRNRVG